MPRRKRPSPARKVFLSFVFIILALGALTAWLLLFPFGPQAETFVDLPAHTGTLGIAQALQNKRVIRTKWAFLALRELQGGTLKAGEYRFTEPASLWEVYDRLRRGDVYTVSVVIPEGFDLFDVAQAVETAGLVPREVFLQAAAANVALVHPWDPKATSVEGYLFPDTYRFSRHTTPLTMLQAMTHRFQQTALRLGLAGPEEHRTVTMASLIEREVHVDAERPLVAGVFENRLRAGMPLQTDPAVAYASMLRGTWTGVIHQSELHSDSPYNTYTHVGLPPGPICNPGLAAMRAALHPETTEYMYFVANPDGSTRFARDLKEHTANVVAYRAGLAPGKTGGKAAGRGANR